MKIEKKQLGVYGANCYIVSKNKETLIVDPGGDADEIIEYIENKDLNPIAIILTHGHGDHIGGVEELKEKYGIKVYVNDKDEELLLDGEKNLSKYMPLKKEVVLESYTTFKSDEILNIGDFKIEAIGTPGHTRGSTCFLIEDKLFTGDTLFKGTVGRTDLYSGGNDLIDSIKEKILKLNESIKIYPGHGAESTILEEKNSNSFLKGLKV